MTPLFLSNLNSLHPYSTLIILQGPIVPSRKYAERLKCSLHSSTLRACLGLRQPFPKHADYPAVLAGCSAGHRQQGHYCSGGRCKFKRDQSGTRPTHRSVASRDDKGRTDC